MSIVLEESEATVLLLCVIWGAVDDDVSQTISVLFELLDDLVPGLAFGDVPNKQTEVGDGDVALKMLALADLVVVKLNRYIRIKSRYQF